METSNNLLIKLNENQKGIWCELPFMIHELPEGWRYFVNFILKKKKAYFTMNFFAIDTDCLLFYQPYLNLLKSGLLFIY